MLVLLQGALGCQRGRTPTDVAASPTEGQESQAAQPSNALASGSQAGSAATAPWQTCGDACTEVGFRLLANGDIAGAVPALALACAAGDLVACSGFDLHAAQICASEEVVERLRSETSCDGNPLHCFIHSEIALHCEADSAKALMYAEAGCQSDDMPSCQQIGELQMTLLDDAESGVRRFGIACDRGYANGCYRSGMGSLERAPHFRPDRGLAEEYLARGCGLGFPPACEQLRISREGR